MLSFEVKKEFICLPQMPVDPQSCPACNIEGKCPSGCTCGGSPPICVPNPFIISNADFEITETGGIGAIRPSDVLQYAIFSSPCPDKLKSEFLGSS